MPSYKLMYFNISGRAEAARMLFALGGQEFEDYRFKEGEWPTIKGDATLFPLGQVPVLIIDGKSMPHSAAIARHLAREFGLYGANNGEASRIDILDETVNDIVTKFVPLYNEKDEAKKKEGIDSVRDTGSKPGMTFLENAIKEAGGRFYVGGKESLGDITVYRMLDFATLLFGEEYLSKTYPALTAFYQGITTNSRLSEYLKNRPN